MKTIKIFLASSAEMDTDKRDFGVFINDKNKEWQNENLFIELTTWKDFVSAISEDRTQNKYNEYIKKCDIVLILFHTKVGQYTHEEFDVAYQSYITTGRKPKIFTYFKTDYSSSSDIEKFKQKIDTLQQFYDTYSDENDLYYKFNKQLEKLADEGFIKRERIDIKKSIHYAIYYILIPALILILVYTCFNYFTPGNSTIFLKERTSHALPFNGAAITLNYSDKSETIKIGSISDVAIFKEIHARHFGKQATISVKSDGYYTIDTTLDLLKKIELTLQRDQSLAYIIGNITDENNRPIEGATVKVLDITTTSDNTGFFRIDIPLEKQQTEQRLNVFKTNYQTWDFTAPISSSVEWKIVLTK